MQPGWLDLLMPYKDAESRWACIFKVMEHKQISETCHVPQLLKLKVSDFWIKSFALLGRGSLPSSSIQVMMDDVRLKERMMFHSKAESWEEILMVLTEEDAVLDQGDLRLQPVFFSLPNIVQTRFLHLVQQNAPKICSHQLNTFVTRLENAGTAKTHWTEFYISNLHQYLNTVLTRDDSTKSQAPDDYTFCAASQTLLTDLFENLKTSTPISCKTPHTSVDVPAKSGCNDQTSESRGSEKVVDVIIIEDGSEDSEETPSLVIKTGIDGREENAFSVLRPTEKSVCVDRNRNGKTASENAKSIPHASSKLVDVSEAQGGKRKFTDVGANDIFSISDEDDCGPVLKAPKLVGQTELSSMHAHHGESAAFQDQLRYSLSNSTKENLVKLKEACFGDNKTTGIVSNKLSFLPGLSASELKYACDYLKLSECSEESLMQFSEAVPWTKLDDGCALALLYGCLYTKLSEELVVDVDDNLLNILQAVVNRHPDLDPVNLTFLLALLARSGQVSANSPRLGKCLMACLTKYSKLMTAENLATLSSLVDTHGSNLKAGLKATLKRLNK
ncbi:hypothetical protein ElyMa_005792000 [Elysia marginata]|uniref:Fanconi Anaemia group E protein C-terminal domain-containing protein n=1 Tax=Elysia marginata TaxID=1093978 RepID=A0AAV4FRS9_9GAST|nr:hypothetical protein ElyMa_005792000 [Elysia marginata]